MTRRPGEEPDEDETPGGRAARRRQEHLAARYGEGEEDAAGDADEPSDEPLGEHFGEQHAEENVGENASADPEEPPRP